MRMRTSNGCSSAWSASVHASIANLLIAYGLEMAPARMTLSEPMVVIRPLLSIISGPKPLVMR
jgi:hypothetical protein